MKPTPEEVKKLAEELMELSRVIDIPQWELIRRSSYTITQLQSSLEEAEQSHSQLLADVKRYKQLIERYATWNFQTGQTVHIVSCNREDIENRVEQYNKGLVGNEVPAKIVPSNEFAIALTAPSQPKESK